MPNRPWRDRLQEALLRQALPKDYVERLVEELSDHAEDFSQEELSMDALEDRLGSPEQLAIVARQELQRRTLAGRRPALVFLGGPLVAVFIAFLLFVLMMGGLLGLLEVCGILHPATALAAGIIEFCNLSVCFASFALPAWIFMRLGLRCGRPVWGAIACGITAAAAFNFCSVIYPPGAREEMGLWMLGFSWYRFGFAQVLQAAAPCALGLWLLLPFMKGPTPVLE